jgi:hypothetical protein
LVHNIEEQHQGKDKEYDWHEAFITEAINSIKNYMKMQGW